MVFESLVADLLNKYLGDFVENLDKSQLNIGIWGGDVKLKNLDLKPSALDDLDLPIKVVSGHLGTLILKIPWKKIYTEPVEVVIEDLFALVSPNAVLVYDEAKEAQERMDKKMKQINRAESLKLVDETKENEKKSDSFGEKLATQIVKNLQVTIRNIHVRYEDFYTTPDTPFAIGVTLDNLQFKSVHRYMEDFDQLEFTDALETINTGAKASKETSSKIFKNVVLSHLALYLNSNCQTYQLGARESIYQTMKKSIPRTDHSVPHKYVICPINCEVDLQIDTKPEISNFSTPKIILKLVLQEIGLQLSKIQYYDIMEMLESFERLVLSDKFRKYRVGLPSKPSHKQRWRFAYRCILEEKVKRRRSMWAWINIKRYREIMKTYKQAYIKRLAGVKKSGEMLKVIEQCEKELDAFAIILMRSQAEMEFAKQQKLEKSKSGGLFGFLRRKPEKDKGLTDQISELMTDEEYKKLYAAIGYEKNKPESLPTEYVAHKMRFELGTISLTLIDSIEDKMESLLRLEVHDLYADVNQRPSADNLRLSARMGSFGVLGLAQTAFRPDIIRSLTAGHRDLLELDFELNPLDRKCDQSVRLMARPVEIVYDAPTVNHLVSFFKPPEHVKLKQLSKAAVTRYKSLKQQSAAGIKDIVSHHKYTEVNVMVDASYVVIPETGTYRPGKTPAVIVDFGQLTVRSERDVDAPKKYRAEAVMNKARKEGHLDQADGQDEMLDKVIERAYDSFTFQMSNFQALYVHPGSDWLANRDKTMSPMHIIQPIKYSLLLQNCMIEDPRLANIKILGKMPQCLITISDEQIVDLLRLVLSIPLPVQVLEAADSEDDLSQEAVDDLRASEMIIEEEKELLVDREKSKVVKNATNMTEVELSFEIEEIEVQVAQTVKESLSPLLKLKLDAVGLRLGVRSFDIVIDSYLGGIYLQHLHSKVPDSMIEWTANQSPRKHEKVTENGAVVNLINTPHDGTTSKLLMVSFVMANNDSPEFKTTYRSTEQKLDVVFSSMEFLLHEDALLNLMVFGQDLQAKIAASKPTSSDEPTAPHHRRRSSNLSDVADLISKQATKQAAKFLEPKDKPFEVVKFSLSAKMEHIDCSVCTKDKLITNLKITGFETRVKVLVPQTEVSAILSDITVYDPEPKTRYPKVMCIEDGNVFRLDVIVYNGATRGSRRYADTSRVDTRLSLSISSIRFVFLYRFINQLINFANNFDVAKQQAIEISYKAGEMAKDAAQNLATKATRIALNITVKAPIIIVPSNSSSNSALLIDLGIINVNNSFTQAKTSQPRAAGALPPILDHMVVKLSQLQIRRSLLDPQNFIKSLAVCQILDPLTLEAEITRNLALAEFHEVPDVEIKARLPEVKMTCSQEDLTCLVVILHENLEEGYEPPDPERVMKQIEDRQAGTTPGKDTSLNSPRSLPLVPLTPATQIYTRLKLSFKLKSVQAVLFLGSSGLEVSSSVKKTSSSGVPTVQRQPSAALARFSIKELKADLLMKSDNSMQAAVGLLQCNLDDMRPDFSSGITRMIERVKGDSDQNSEMIKLVFAQKANLSKTVDIHINKLFIIVCVPYLIAVSDFFIKGLPKFEPRQQAVVKQHQEVIATDVTNDTLAIAEMKIQVHCKNPEIILVEDTMGKLTNALILDAGFTFDMRLSPESMLINSTLNLQVISAKYKTEQRVYEKIAQIMSPCTVTVNGSAPENKAAHINVELTTLDLCVSPAVITTIGKIATNLQLSSADALLNSKKSIMPLWSIEKISRLTFWYLNTTPPELDLQDYEALANQKEGKKERGEQVVISCSNIVVKLEGGIGNKTVPLLVAEMELFGEVKDWSTKLLVKCEASLAVSYFNEQSCVWEPFLEPVERTKGFEPWHLQLEVKQNDDFYDLDDDESDCDVIAIQPPLHTISLESQDIMQICLSKAGLDMLTSLGKAFGDAYNQVQPSVRAGESVAPYSLRNDLDVVVSVTIDSQLEILAEGDAMPLSAGELVIQPGKLIPLQLRKSTTESGMKKSESLLKRAQEGKEFEFVLSFPDYNATRDLVVQKSLTRLFNLYQQSAAVPIVVQTTADLGRRQVIIRSDTQLINGLDQAVKLYHDSPDGITELCVLDVGDNFNLPPGLLYGKKSSLRLQPIVPGLEMCSQSLVMSSLNKKEGTTISCPFTAKPKSLFHILLWPEIENVYTESSNEKSSRIITYHLRSPVSLHNQLPYKLSVQLTGQPVLVIPPGETTALPSCPASGHAADLTVHDYLESDWTTSSVIGKSGASKMESLELKQSGSSSKELRLVVLNLVQTGTRRLALYAPYWFLNRTNLEVSYRDSSVRDVDTTYAVHPAEYDRPFLFAYNRLSHQDKAVMRVSDSNWSDKFSLDTAGSSGTVVCKGKETNYEVGVKITLASNGLTKIVEVSPFFILVNKTMTTISFTEQVAGGGAIAVPPEQCRGLWSRTSKKSREMCISVTDDEIYPVSSPPFSFSTVHCTLLKLSDKVSYNVEVTISELSVLITVESYRAGMEAARIVNCSADLSVQFHQIDCQDNVMILEPGETVLYTWDNPLSKRILVWSSGQEVNKKNELLKDGLGEYFADKDSNHKVFWVSFLDGIQRVFMFTEDYYQVSRARDAGEFVRMDQEILLNIEGVGLSLVDNNSQREVSYFSIASSGVVWEEKKRRRWRPFSNKISLALEEVAQKLERLKAAQKSANTVVSIDKLQFDLADMRMISPHRRIIRRTFQPGVWAQYKTSKYQTQLHAKVNRIQLDNQLPDAVYPVVFSPTPLPKSVADESIPKPLIEASLVMRKHEHTNVQQVKYLKVLVQEMTLKADKGFINTLLQFFASKKERTKEQLSKDFQSDVEYLQATLFETAAGTQGRGQKNFYDTVHFSPLKLHLSFSVTGSGKSGAPIQSEVVQLFLQSVGVALTDINDIVLRIAYFERNYVFYEPKILVAQIQRHYTNQAISEVYKLVFGLDVLGNPFGLVQGLAEGAKDLFYEPIQGAIQGPEEFVEGLGLGLRSLLSGTLGGAAGAVSRITGTMGKGLAALTLDKKYQQQRREKMNKQPDNIGEGLLRGVKGLGMGLFDGVTGIVRKPVEGAKEEGVGGFFKGVGKGLIGVVARPTGGIVDFASSSFEGIRRITTLSGVVLRIRPPRIIRADGIITPYSYRQAAGAHILMETDNGRYSQTDEFLAHAIVTSDGRNALLVTDKRVIFVKKGEVFGHWDHEWHYDWRQLTEPPSLEGGFKLKFLAQEPEKKFNLFSRKTPQGKLVPLPDSRQAEWMLNKVQEAYAKCLTQTAI